MTMRLAFLGASAFGLQCLERVIDRNLAEVVGVVTLPKTFAISYRPTGVTNVLYADFTKLCEARGIPCHVMQGKMSDNDLLARVSQWRADNFLVAGWYHLVPRSWRNMAPAYGLHASLLPDYSGGAPLVWAMINGEAETGITLFQFDEGVDSGPIVGQARTEIRESDTIATLYDRIRELGLDLLQEHLPALADERAQLVPQDHTKRRVFPQRGPEDGRIDWLQSAQHVRDFVRAQTRPYPGAFTEYTGKKVTIWACEHSSRSPKTLAHGELSLSGEQLLVGCGAGTTLRLTSLAIDGIDQDPLKWWRREGSTGRGEFDRWAIHRA